MKRLLISLLCGFVIPLVYSIIIAPTSQYIPSRTLRNLTGLPVRWPIILLDQYTFSTFPPRPSPMKSELAMLLYFIICNVVLYGSLTYFILWSLKKRRESRLPPPVPPAIAD